MKLHPIEQEREQIALTARAPRQERKKGGEGAPCCATRRKNMNVLVRCGQASLILKKFDKDKDGELGLEDMKALMKKINKK